MGLIVTDGRDFFSEEKRDADSEWLADGVPAFRLVNTCRQARLLVDLARREKALAEADVAQFWPMARKAVAYLVCNAHKPTRSLGRRSRLFAVHGLGRNRRAPGGGGSGRFESRTINCNLPTRDCRCLERIHRTLHVCFRHRLVPGNRRRRVLHPDRSIEKGEDVSRFQGSILIKNVSHDQSDPHRQSFSESRRTGPGAFRPACCGRSSHSRHDKSDRCIAQGGDPHGPIWHRYNGDGYGEHEDGAPFDGTGIGRGWPLLTGERAHYELAAKRLEAAKNLLGTMESFANEGGLISEQVWDTADILGWAHAEYLKLRRSLQESRVFDPPPQTVQRYLIEKTGSPRIAWRLNHKIRSMPAGKILRIETMAPAVIR